MQNACLHEQFSRLNDFQCVGHVRVDVSCGVPFSLPSLSILPILDVLYAIYDQIRTFTNDSLLIPQNIVAALSVGRILRFPSVLVLFLPI